jgi:hypothetical protein
MHLGLGITFHLIAIFNACTSIYFYSLFNKKHKESIISIVTVGLSVILLLFGLYGLFWDLTKNINYDYYGSPKSTNSIFIMFELLLILLTMIFSLVIAYHEEYGLIKVEYLNDKEHNNVVALIAVQLVFISYITLIMVYKLLQNYDLVD